MTKTILTILIGLYSLARLATVAIIYYYEQMRLPFAVVVVSVVVSLLMLIIAGRCYVFRLSGKNLRFALLLGALAATANMVLVMLNQPGTLNYAELLVTGTVFDIVWFLGCCTIKIRDTRGKAGRTPFSRLVMSLRNNDEQPRNLPRSRSGS